MPLVPRPGILDIAPYVAGEAKAAGAERLIRLASNEGALGPSPRAVAAYTAIAEELHRYPDPHSTALREALGRRHGLDPARIVCGTGSDDLIMLAARAFAGPGDEVVYSAHGFILYPIVARSVGATPVAAPERGLRLDVDAILERVTMRPRIVYVTNPNNPTGSYVPAGEIARLHAGLPDSVLLVIDAAYAEYMTAEDYTAGLELVDAADNVIVTRTFSKIYALGALRLGWAYCPPAVADLFNRIRNPFSTTAAAQSAGVAAVEDEAFVAESRAHNDRVRAWFSDACRKLGLTVHPSVTNFVLVSFARQAPGRDDAEAARLFLKERGILVRQMGAYGLGDCLRISIGRDDEMQAAAAALGAFLHD